MRVLGAVIAVLIAASCSAPSTSALRVVRYAGMDPVAAFDRSVNDGAAAQRLYDALVSLPFAHSRWCAYGSGADYRLEFSDTVRRTFAATVEIGGCYEASFMGLIDALRTTPSGRSSRTHLGWDLGTPINSFHSR